MIRRMVFMSGWAILLTASHHASAVDNAEWEKRTGVKRYGADSGGKLDPNAVPGMALWLDASEGVETDAEGKVRLWRDRSGRGHDLAQENPELQVELLESAIAGRAVVRFSGTEHFARGLAGQITLGDSGATVLALVRQRKETYAGTLFKYGPDNAVRGLGIGVNRLAGWADPEKAFSLSVTSSEWLPGEGFQLIALRSDFRTGETLLYRQGRQVGRSKRAGGLRVERSGLLQLGGARVGRTNCAGSCNSDLAELIVVARPVTRGELVGLEGYLRAKWGLEALDESVTPLADRLPFAYYPSAKEIELAFDKGAPLLVEYFGDVHRAAGRPGALTPGLAWATWEGDKLPGDPAKTAPAKTGIVESLDLPGGGFDPPTGTPYVVAGWLEVPTRGTYTFVLRPQSASRLMIDGKTVADQSEHKDTWGTWNWRGGAVALEAGPHRITLLGLAQPRRIEHERLPLVLWSGPRSWRKTIPGARLGHVKGDAIAPPSAEQDAPHGIPSALKSLSSVPFRVVDAATGRRVSGGTLKLDPAGRGQSRFRVGDLKEGEYAIEYRIGRTPVRLPQTFARVKFPWEGNDLGKGHEVFPPFTPVEVRGATVSTVGRTYRMNALGMMDSVRSLDRELLARPMKVIARSGGKDLKFRPGRVSGRKVHPDLAEFTGRATSDALVIRAKTSVEEDGCCRVEWTMSPGARPATIDWLELVIPMKEKEAPLFGWSAQDSMRHHYWGKVPPPGEIIWDTDQGKAPGWVPAAWTKGAGPAPADGMVWNSTRNMHWRRGNYDPFVCYVWMGAEERGLAWWADRPGEFSHDGTQPIQLVCREPGRVTLRVRVIQVPTVIKEPRKLVFGLQASPTKPLRPDWRTHPVPGGGGLAVVCWGGYYCASKYPDNHDYAVVDQIMRMATEYRDGLEADVLAEIRKLDAERLWKDVQVFGDSDWVTAQTWFMQPARWKYCASYVEEHAHYVRMPEWQAFQDEWSGLEFNRFQNSDGNYGVIAPSYHDFAIYYQNEYMRRGVSLYYDNSFPREERNPFVLDGERDSAAGLWGLRSYYKRVWKQLKRLERDKVPPLPLDFTVHLTNCKLLPLHTWCTNLLDFEQPYRAGKPVPPDYTRAMTSGRHVGVVAHAMHPLANYNDYRDQKTGKWTEAMAVADWSMFRVNEVRSTFYADWRREWKLWKSFRDAFVRVGYGSRKETVINYWEPRDPVNVRAGEDVAWIAVRAAQDGKTPPGVLGIVLLQSYAQSGTRATVAWKGAGALVDHRTRRTLSRSGRAKVGLPGRFGTALLWAVARPADVPAR